MVNTFKLSADQEKVFNEILEFLSDDSKDIFILHGYAGTGKTFLITYLGNFLQNNHWQFEVLAPTGRAAKVLRDKFTDAVEQYGFCKELSDKGSTIHSAIYSRKIECKEVGNADVAVKSYKFFFPLSVRLMPANEESVFIVDESSMIGDNEVVQEFLQFGSGRLLSDLLEFKRVCRIGKIIFVGDDAQLPPVGDPESRAMDKDHLCGEGFGVSEGFLTEVIRQKKGSGILKNAQYLRSILQTERSQRTNLYFQEGEDVKFIKDDNIARQYVEAISYKPEIGKQVLVCYTNRQCHTYNQAIREILFTDAEKIIYKGEQIIKVRKDDILLNTKNSRGTWGRDLFNGDSLKVVEVGSEIKRTVPVSIKGEKQKIHVELTFTEVILTENDVDFFSAMLLNNQLYSPEVDLTVPEIRALYIDFCIRVKNKYPNIKEGSDEFKQLLLNDVFFNSLRVKFGYAITCHKAQGGEWETAWVDYTGRIGLFDDAIKWCYTSTTRAKSMLRAINPPVVSMFHKLKFLSVKSVKKPFEGFFCESMRVDEKGTESAPVGVSLKIRGLRESLKTTNFVLKSFSVVGYQIILEFQCENKIIKIDNYFDKEGLTKRLNTSGNGSDEDKLKTLFNDAVFVVDINYHPSNNTLAELYERMKSLCDEYDVKILNVVEKPQSFMVLYGLKTDATFAYIQFYYNIDSTLSTALPMSELGEKDVKLINLITNF